MNDQAASAESLGTLRLDSYDQMDDILCNVADSLTSDDQIEKLGKVLGFKYWDISRFIQTNYKGPHVTSRGTKNMLRDWAIRIESSKQWVTLRRCLAYAGLIQVAQSCLPKHTAPGQIASASGQGHLLQAEEVRKLKEELMLRYRQEFSWIKTFPLDPKTRRRLDNIYTDVILRLAERHGDLMDGHQLTHQELFSLLTTETEVGQPARVAIVGEAGIGKSTLLAKIAFDWATGKCLQGIDLLFLVPLQEVHSRNENFGDIIIDWVEMRLEGSRVDEYIRNYQRKIMILFDGLDEYDGDITNENSGDAVVRILRGSIFKHCPVLVTSRPWRAQQITGNNKMSKLYAYVHIDGFKKDDVAKYVGKFLNDDPTSAQCLIRVMEETILGKEHESAFPIFCSMLCHVWKEEASRNELNSLNTVGLLVKEIVNSLVEHYASKAISTAKKDVNYDKIYSESRCRCIASFQEVGRVAFQGLLKRRQVFLEEDFKDCMDAANLAHDVGILTKEQKVAPRQIRQKEGKLHLVEMKFPHKLVQEYLAGAYLASLYKSNRSEFDRVLESRVLLDAEEFRYLLYFLAGFDLDAGKSLMEAMCSSIKDDNFIFDVCYECGRKDVLGPVVSQLREKKSIFLSWNMLRHSQLGLFCALRAHHEMASADGSTDAISSSLSGSAARGLMTLPELRSLDLTHPHLDDEFYEGLACAAHRSLIEKMAVEYLDVIESYTSTRHVATALFSMPNLRTLRIGSCKEVPKVLRDVMVDKSANIKIEDLCLKHDHPMSLGAEESSRLLRAFFSMPNLLSLKIPGAKLTDWNFPKDLPGVAAASSIRTLKLEYFRMTPTILRIIVSLPHLQTLALDHVTCDEGKDRVPQEAELSVDEFLKQSVCCNSLTELAVDSQSMLKISSLDVHAMCPRVKKIDLRFYEKVTWDAIVFACHAFPSIVEVRLESGLLADSNALDDPASFCDALMTSCPLLHSLTISHIRLGNESARDVINHMVVHKSLKKITLTKCNTNEELDPFIAEVSGRRDMEVIVKVKHGWLLSQKTSQRS